MPPSIDHSPFVSSSPGEVVSVTEVPDIAFKTIDGHTLRLDVFHPPLQQKPSSLRPVAIFVHGGGWKVGSRKAILGRCAVGSSFARRGFVGIAVSYRLSRVAASCVIRVYVGLAIFLGCVLLSVVLTVPLSEASRAGAVAGAFAAPLLALLACDPCFTWRRGCGAGPVHPAH